MAVLRKKARYFSLLNNRDLRKNNDHFINLIFGNLFILFQKLNLRKKQHIIFTSNFFFLIFKVIVQTLSLM